MSVEDRVRTGLREYAAGLRPDVDGELSLLLVRARRRRGLRRAALATTAAVASAVGLLALFGGLSPHSDDRGNPDELVPLGPIATDDFVQPLPIDPGFFTGELRPGVYVHPFVAPGSKGLPQALVAVPAGYRSDGRWLTSGCAVPRLHQVGCGARGRSLTFWVVDQVNTRPCQGFSWVDPGPTSADLATALAAQPLRGTASPEPVTLGGHDALSLELSVPATLDLASCLSGEFGVWRSGTTPLRVRVPGQIDRVWIVEVQGHRLVLDASYGPDAPASAVAALIRMAETVTFTR